MKYENTELYFLNGEIKMLTDMIAERIAKSDKAFKKYLKCKTEIDFEFLSSEINADKFIEKIVFTDLGDSNYFSEFIDRIKPNMEYLKLIYKSNEINKTGLGITNFKYNLDNKNINITFSHINTPKEICKIKIDYFDIIWGLIIFKTMPLYEIIHREIVFAPFL